MLSSVDYSSMSNPSFKDLVSRLALPTISALNVEVSDVMNRSAKVQVQGGVLAY